MPSKQEAANALEEETCPNQTCLVRKEAQRSLEERRRQLLKRLLTLHEEERLQVARELHEGAGQMLTSLLFGLKMLEESTSLEEVNRYLPELKSQTWEALETMRQIAISLRPPLLEDLGLVSTLRGFAREFGAHHRLELFFSCEGKEVRLPAMTEVQIFRIVQEALLNAAKYSEATQLSISLTFSPAALVVKVEDNGVGLDPAQVDWTREPVGLVGMQERAHFVGGVCSIESVAGQGVSVLLNVPVP